MLEVRNLFKTYKTKGGVITKALDDVSIVFPETGMIFLLGKSGSGKSTLLNVIGGLDRPDKGEIIIKGRNSKTFSGSDFDSYRNTYIGFVFQEYNILNEFNVEQNISLALQLQGKPNDKKTVEAILEQVDLQGYGKRKPNTLSGGQKQRVAIARALIKNPEIIMADEPTGALDSNTGKQVFETLKKLSETKLVIVVSHDRDFAEYYGDRIIELSDGKVICDISKQSVEAVSASENIQIVNKNTVAIKDTSKLTKADMDIILKALKENEGEAVISSGEHDLPLVRQAIHLNVDNSSDSFDDTKEVAVKEYDGKKTKFIRSRLPFARAFKMGSSSLKTKPIRLIFTAFLTSVSLTMFGLTSTLMLFKDSYSLSRSLQNSGRVSEAVRKEYKYQSRNYRIDIVTDEKEYDDNEETYTYYAETMFSQNDLDSLNNNSVGLKFAGVYRFANQSFNGIDTSSLNGEYFLRKEIDGFMDISQQVMDAHNLSIEAGNLPANSNQIMVSRYAFELLKSKYESISSYGDIVGKEYTIELWDYFGHGEGKNFTVSGVLNVGDIPTEYNVLRDNPNSISDNKKSQLRDRLSDLLERSYHTIIYVHPSFYENVYYPKMGEQTGYVNNRDLRSYDTKGLIVNEYPIGEEEKNDINNRWNNFYTYENLFEQKEDYIFYDLNGEETEIKESFTENDIYVPYENLRWKLEDAYRNYFYNANELIDNSYYDPTLYTLLEDENTKIDYRATIERLANNYAYDYYPEEYDKETDYNKIKGLLDNYYVNVKTRQYTFDAAEFYCSRYQDSKGWDESQYSSEFIAFRDQFYDARSINPYKLNNYNTIVTYLTNDADGYTKLYNLYRWVEMMPEVDETSRATLDVFREKYWNNQSISNDLFISVENIVKTKLSNYQTGYCTAHITNPQIAINHSTYYYYSYKGNEGKFNLVGYYSTKEKGGWGPYILKKSFILDNSTIENRYWWGSEETTDYQPNGAPKYSWSITRSTYSQRQIEFMKSDFDSYRFNFHNRTTNTIEYILSLIALLKTIFLAVGITFAVFAALMLLNFITTSITAKTKEIGILRAVGARGSDLFKIFFSESGLIVIICLVVALAASIAGCIIFNNYMIQEVGLAMLDFGVLNIAIMIGGAFIIAFLGTFFPVLRAAKRPPVESIRVL